MNMFPAIEKARKQAGLGCYECQAEGWPTDGVPAALSGGRHGPVVLGDAAFLLGQMSFLRVRTVDRAGNPFPGVAVVVDTPNARITVATNVDGFAILTVPVHPGTSVKATAEFPGESIPAAVTTAPDMVSGEPVIFASNTKAPQAAVSLLEGALFSIGVLSTIFGFSTEQPVAKWGGLLSMAGAVGLNAGRHTGIIA